MFIQTEATRDPASLKFLPGRDVLPGRTLSISNRSEAARSPLAAPPKGRRRFQPWAAAAILVV